MPFQQISAPSLRELFVQQLEGLILSGELRPGDHLPTERELADEMKISKTVVHEGLRELHRLGFLQIESRKGVTVADYAQTGSLETLMAIMDYNGGTLGREEIRSILEVRWGLEQMALRRVIDYASDEDLERLGAFVDALGKLPTAAQAADIAFRFHHEMTLMGGNHILPLIYTSFRVPCTALWIRFCRKYGVEALYRNIEELYRLLLNRDLEGALRWSTTYLEEAIRGHQQIYHA